MTRLEQWLNDRFTAAVLVLVVSYAILQAIYVARLPLVMDEFDGAYEAYSLRHAVPYRDFAPYKTVVGYYIEALPTFAVRGVWGRILAIKTEIILINSVTIAVAALYLKRFFRPAAIVLSLLLLLACSNFAERSSELRVDMLTAWAGLGSFLFLIGRRHKLAGIACGIGFLISQKAAFYFVAANVAMSIEWIVRARTGRELRKLAAFNAWFAIPVVAYLAVWSAVSSPAAVIGSTFVGAAAAGFYGAYAIWTQFWSQTLIRDPLLFGLAPVAIIFVARRNIIVAAYAAAVFVQALFYSQPWPYFFVLLAPTLFVLYSAFFEPFSIRPAMLVIVLLVGVAYPLLRIAAVLRRHNDYQRYNVDVVSAMLRPGDTYIAGNDIIHDREQSLPNLRRLDALTIARLRMLAPADLDRIADEVDRSRPKLVLATNRIHALPEVLRRRIDRSYAQLTGSIFSYAPRFGPGSGTIAIAFPGRYRLEGDAEVNGVPLRSGDDVNLRGLVRISSGRGGRVHFLPEDVERLLDSRYVVEREFFPDVYGY